MRITTEFKLKNLIKDHQHNKTLSRGKSNAVLYADCPNCEYGWRCIGYKKGNLQLCILHSTESDMVWLRLPNNNIDVNDKFGLLTILKYNGKIKGRSSWYCLCDCGNLVDAREDNLINGNTKSCGCQRGKTSRQKDYIESNLVKKYRRGSRLNPDGTIHKYHISSDGHSKTNMSLWEDTLEGNNKISRMIRCRECDAIVRYDEYGDRQCTGCGLIY